MTTPHPPATSSPVPSDDANLDEALEETFPASDPVAPARREKLPPEDPPGSDVDDR